MSRAGRRGAEWERAVREHRAALSCFAASASALDAQAWRHPLAEGKWSPAEVTEHLALVYEALLRELAGGPPMRMRVGGWTQRVLRWVVLPHILFHRSIPVRVRAPREARPGGGALDQGALVRRLREGGEQLERALEGRREGRVTHPYFGSLPAARALRFCAAHMEHHHRQIAPAPTTRAG